MNSTVDDYNLLKSMNFENSQEYQDLSSANDLKGIMFEEKIKSVGKQKKIDYYKLSK